MLPTAIKHIIKGDMDEFLLESATILKISKNFF